MAEGDVEVRGVIAMNGRGELCFFPDSFANGVPLPRGGSPSATLDALDRLLDAVKAAPPRRVSHATLALLDPEELRDG